MKKNSTLKKKRGLSIDQVQRRCSFFFLFFFLECKKKT